MNYPEPPKSRDGVGRTLTAETTIREECKRILFADLLYILSNVEEKYVSLLTAKDSIDVEAVFKMSLEMMRPEGPSLTNAEIAFLRKERIRRFHPFQAVRFDFPQRIVIIVYDLTPEWLAATDENGIKNSDAVHVAIAHEVLGCLLGLDDRGIIDPSSLPDRQERHTHSLAAKHVVEHWLRHKSYHHVPRFYAYTGHRTKILSLLYRAAVEFSERRTTSHIVPAEDEFLSKVAEKLDKEATSRQHDHLRACPFVWGGLRCHEVNHADPEKKGFVKTVSVHGAMNTGDCKDAAMCPLRELC